MAAQAGTVATHGGEGGAAKPTLKQADEYSCRLCDGSSWAPPAPQPGFASSGRLPTRRKSAAQLKFILFAAHDLKDAGFEALHGHEASECMLLMGTQVMARRWPTVPYAAATTDGLPHLPCTARLEPSELTPILKLTRPVIEAKLKRLRDREASVGAGEDEEDEEDEEEGSRKRKRGGGGKAKGSKRAKGGAVVLACWASRRSRRCAGAPTCRLPIWPRRAGCRG